MIARFKWAIFFFILFLIIIPVQIVLVVGQANQAEGHEIQTPGEAVVTLEQAGEFTLWFQSQATQGLSSTRYPVGAPDGFNITITRESDQSQVPIQSGSMRKTMTLGNMQRESFAAVSIPEPGDYRLAVTGSAEPRLVYFSKDIIGKIIGMSIAFGCATLILFALAVIMALVAITRKPKPATLDGQPVEVV